MLPIVSIVGKSGSGKTTLLTKLIVELKRRGYRVATVKHDVHGFEVDHEGKDSWRHAQAGSDTTIISGPGKIAVIKKLADELPLQKIAALYVDDVDILLTEGYKREGQFKIEVSRRAVSDELVCNPEELVAVVGDNGLGLSIPSFALDDVKGIADLIENRFVKDKVRDVALMVDGEAVKLKAFVVEAFIETLFGMVSSLKGTDGAGKVNISASRESFGVGSEEKKESGEGRPSTHSDDGLKVSLAIDGEDVALNEFVHGFLAKTLKGMVASLRGGDEGSKIVLSLEILR